MTQVIKGFRVELDPNNRQITLFKKHCGAVRWAYNWALSKKMEAFEKKDKIPTHIDLHKIVNKLKGTEALPWGYDVSKVAFQSGLQNCDVAFKNFYRSLKKKDNKFKFPKFKCKKRSVKSFKSEGSVVLVNGTHIRLPRIGLVKIKQVGYIPSDCKIKFAVTREISNRWFVSCCIEYEVESKQNINNITGVDLGIKTLATCSDETIFENPKALHKNIKRLKRRSRQFSKKQNGGKNYEKARQKLAKLHYRVSNIRKDALHKATTKIINENQVIVLEDLSVSRMRKNSKLALSINDVSFYEFRRQIEYKAKWYGRTVVIANRFYPSSKIDHKSGRINSKLTLSDRVIHHEDGTTTDRDLNAAINLRNYYLNNLHTAGSAGIQVCGEKNAGVDEN